MARVGPRPRGILLRPRAGDESTAHGLSQPIVTDRARSPASGIAQARHDPSHSREERRSPMALTVGIIGLPQSGKTTLFNALTRAGAQISGYPTSTVQANRAVVEVPDERLQRLAEIFHPRKVVPTTIEFLAVAGLGAGAGGSKGGGAWAAVVRPILTPPPT